MFLPYLYCRSVEANCVRHFYEIYKIFRCLGERILSFLWSIFIIEGFRRTQFIPTFYENNLMPIEKDYFEYIYEYAYSLLYCG